MKFTITHNYIFPAPGSGQPVTSLLSPAAWDAVRTSTPGDGFFLPAQRGAWMELCLSSDTARDCAASIGAGLTSRSLGEVFSVGVGRACVEFHLKLIQPGLKLVCTDYGPLAVERLRAVFIESEGIQEFNLLKGAWPSLAADGIVLLNRVDTELTDEQWQQVFAGLAACGIRRVLIIATGFVDLRTLALELRTRLRGRFGGRTLTHAGYIRTKERFVDLWKGCYASEEEGRFSGLTGFWLKRLEPN